MDLILIGVPAFLAGHFIRPWIEETWDDFQRKRNVNYYDDPRADDRTDWRDL
jgi:hypothetical protein